MRFDPNEHPDYYSDRKAFYEIHTGGRQALEDAAIAAYLAAIAAGNTEDEAKAKFFDIYKDATKRI